MMEKQRINNHIRHMRDLRKRLQQTMAEIDARIDDAIDDLRLIDQGNGVPGLSFGWFVMTATQQCRQELDDIDDLTGEIDGQLNDAHHMSLVELRQLDQQGQTAYLQ